jgi:hypothetical protein
MSGSGLSAEAGVADGCTEDPGLDAAGSCWAGIAFAEGVPCARAPLETMARANADRPSSVRGAARLVEGRSAISQLYGRGRGNAEVRPTQRLTP